MPITVLIPALNPTDQLLRVVEELIVSEDVSRVVVINDGSAHSFETTFEQLEKKPRVEVLRHAVNLGKGAALRFGMNHFLCTAAPGEQLVTADADGQHVTRDILAVGARHQITPKSLVLGARSFRRGVPLRSRFGNDLTRLVFHAIIGQSLPDTQTGLRAIPRTLMPPLLKIKANGYEFELEMLILAASTRTPIENVTIETVYLDGNASSHFNPLRDSARIYFVFARFLSSSLMTAVLDYLVFTLTFQWTHKIGLSIIFGRIVAGSFNFIINKNIVFRSKANLSQSVFKYAALVLALGTIAYALITAVVVQRGWNAYLAKVIVESFLLLCSFVLQRNVVFTMKSSTPTDEN